MKRQRDFFSPLPTPKRSKLDKEIIVNAFGIAGLCYIPYFITHQEEHDLMASVDSATWSTALKRRVQHYGYQYNYKSRTLSEEENRIGDLPDWCSSLVDSLCALDIEDEHLWNGEPPNQVIVNEYIPGQGISAHIDNESIFTDFVVSVSLGSDIGMYLQPPKAKEGEEEGTEHLILLERRSALILSKEARYKWKHGIRNRKRDKQLTVFSSDSKPRVKPLVIRERRISLTFRFANVTPQ